MISSYLSRNWLCELGYEYKDNNNDLFIDRHEQSDIVENTKMFLKKTEELTTYLAEFDKNDVINLKVYMWDCIIGGNHWQRIIIITHDHCRFSANDGIGKACVWKTDMILCFQVQR